MQRLGIIDSSRNFGLLQRLPEFSAPLGLDSVLRPGGSLACLYDGCLYQPCQATGVFFGDLVPTGDLVLQNVDLGEQNRRLNRIQSAVHAHSRSLVLRGALPMNAN